jgi:uncharacterized protein YtpQ (UPF0354 family)
MQLRCAVLVLIVLLAGCSRTPPPPAVLSPGEFTQVYADALRQAAPDGTVATIGDLKLTIAVGDRLPTTCYLDNAYNTYKRDPASLGGVVERFVRASLAMHTELIEPIDATRIVPVVKDRAWIDEAVAMVTADGTKQRPDYAFDALNDILVVLYAQDGESSVRYLEEKDLSEARIDRTGLRALALANLRRILPTLQRYGGDRFYSISADGTYESSLILLQDLWLEPGLELVGDPVVALPTRDVLLLTGSEDAVGLKNLREAVQTITQNGSYCITTQLFVLRGGRIIHFAPAATTDGP